MLFAAHGCSSPSPSARPVGSEDAGDENEASLFDIYRTDGPGCTIPPKPATVPDGWELYTEYDPCCLLYTPSAPQYLPPPLKWTSCAPAWSGDAGLSSGCRQVDQAVAGSALFGASVVGSTVTLLTDEIINGLDVHVVVDADGPVHQALAVTDKNRCGPSPRDLRDGRFAYEMYPPTNFNGGGFLAGQVDEFRPSFVHHFTDFQTHGVVVGKLGVLDVDETDSLNLYRWDAGLGADAQVIRNPQDIGLGSSFPLFSSNALFWLANAGGMNRIAVYTEAGGAHDLISFGSDPDEGATDLGADGVDLVWMQGTGHTKDPIAYDTAELMTSPFATDPASLHPRRLRSESPRAMGVTFMKVGCGYAARSNDAYLRIVRISDGGSWVLPQNPGWQWLNALAVTCDEVFVSVSLGADINNVARIRFDALGPPVPAD